MFEKGHLKMMGPRVAPSEKSEYGAAWWLPGFLYPLAFWLFLCAELAKDNFASIDLWGKLAIPAIWFSTGHFPTHDYFSFTAYGHSWIDHEWLSGFIFYQALMWGGDAGLTLLKWGAVGVMSAVVFMAAKFWRGGYLLPLLILLLGLPMLANGFVATGRPQMFTFTAMPLLVVLLEWLRRTKRLALTLWLFLIGLVWGNLHGGFVVGLGLIFFYALAEAFSGRENRQHLKLYVLGGLLFLAGTFVNPYGLSYWQYILYAITLPRTEITEWNSVPLWDASYPRFKILSLLTLLGLLSVPGRFQQMKSPGERRRIWVSVLVLGAFLYQGLAHAKHQPLAVGAMAIFLPWLLKDGYGVYVKPWLDARLQGMFRPTIHSMKTALFMVPLLLLVFGLFQLFMQAKHMNPLVVQVRSERFALKNLRYLPYPVGAVRFLKDSSYQGNLMTPFSWGEFAFWSLYPKFRVSMDGRLEAVYPMPTFRTLRKFSTRKGINWQMAEAAGADFILLERRMLRPDLARVQRQISWNRQQGGHADATDTQGASEDVVIPKRWVKLYEDPMYLVLGAQSSLNRQEKEQNKHEKPNILEEAVVSQVVLPVSYYFVPIEFLKRFETYAKEPVHPL